MHGCRDDIDYDNSNDDDVVLLAIFDLPRGESEPFGGWAIIMPRRRGFGWPSLARSCSINGRWRMSSGCIEHYKSILLFIGIDNVKSDMRIVLSISVALQVFFNYQLIQEISQISESKEEYPCSVMADGDCHRNRANHLLVKVY